MNSEVIVPEFYRDLAADKNLNGLWHFTHRRSADDPKKPERTIDGLAHKEAFDWKEIFPNHNDCIEIEVGSGRGAFLAEYGNRHPEKFILGSEWDYTWAAFVSQIFAMWSGVVPQQPPSRVAPIWEHWEMISPNSSGVMG